jgi:hypothetical protein
MASHESSKNPDRRAWATVMVVGGVAVGAAFLL